MSENAIAVPEWTAEDYRTTAPFEWLYQYRENRFVMMQLCNQIKAAANAQGVKNFMALWKAYLETVQRQAGVTSENATEFTGQPMEMLSGNYICDDFGVSTTDKYGFEVTVCSHPIMPIQRLVNVDTGEVKVEIAYKRGNRWRKLIADKGQLASSQRIIELAKYGVAVDSESARDLVRYLSAIENLNYDKIGEIASVGRLGWIGDHGFSPYVENVRFDGNTKFKKMFEAVQPSGEYAAWIACVRKTRQHGTIARIVTAAAFASALIKPLHALPFVLHLWGGTEAGKTVALMLASSAWANPSMGEYIRTFNSTAVGLEMYAGFCNSLPLCVDELQVVKSRKNFDELVYMLAEGIGRLRGEKTGGVRRTETWNNCTITTGEMPISTGASGGGAVNRVIEIDCKDEKLFEDPAGVVEAIRQNYGHAGRAIITALQEDQALMPAVVDTHKHFYAELIKRESMEKQAIAASLILTADLLIEQVIFQDGVTLTIDDLAGFLTNKADVDVNQRAYYWLLDFVSANPARFTQNAYGNYVGECWGRLDTGCVYINRSVFDAKLDEAGYNSRAFLSWAKRRGLVDYQPPHSTKVARVAGKLARYVCLILPEQEIALTDVHDEVPGGLF